MTDKQKFNTTVLGKIISLMLGAIIGLFIMVNLHHLEFLVKAVGWLVDVLRIGEAP